MFLIISQKYNNVNRIKDEIGFWDFICNKLSFRKILNRTVIDTIQIHKTKSEVLFKEIDDSLVILDSRNRIQDCNNEALNVYDYDYKTLIELNYSDIVYDDKNHIRNGGLIFPVESQLKEVNSKYKILITKDISKKDKEEKILNDIYKISKIGYWQKDINSDLINFSEGMYNIYETNDKKIVEYNNYKQFIHNNDKLKFEKYLDKLKAGREASVEYRIVINGKTKYIISRGRAIVNKEGKALYYYGIIQDVTDNINYKMYYDRMFHNSLVGMWKTRKDEYNKNLITNINKKTLEILDLEELDQSDVIGRDLFEIINLSDRQKKTIVELVRKNKEIDWYELNNVLTRKGKIKHFIISIKLYDNNRIEGLLLDNTYRVNIERQLNNSLDSYKSIFDTSVNSIFVINKENQFIDVNIGSEAMYGYKKEELIGKSFGDLCAGDEYNHNDREQCDGCPRIVCNQACYIDKCIENCYKNNQADTFEFFAKNSKGDIFPTHVQIYKAKYFGSNVVIAISQNITKLKRAEKRLEESNDNYNRLLEFAPVGIISCSVDGKINYLNKKIIELLGSPSTTESKKFNLFTLPNLIESGIADKFKECIEKDKMIYHEGYYTSYWGKKIFFRFYISALKKDEKIYGAIGIAEDFTERKEMLDAIQKQKQELEESNEVLENFAYTTSHDLKTPLRGITTFLDKIDRKLKDINKDAKDEKLDMYMSIVKDSANKMNSIIMDTLNYSRISKNQIKLKENNLYHCVQSVIFIINKNHTYAKNRRILNKVPKDVLLMFDPILLERVFDNLITNALKFNSKDYKEIVIGYNSTEKYIYVKDNGDGIEPEYQEKIFNLFQRLHNSDVDGNGLGLAIVKKVVQRHNWLIKIESELKIGTTFKIYTERKKDD